MSRYEKYRITREQMNNESQIKNALQNPSSYVNHYKAKINEIQPKILLNFQPIEIKLMNLLMIDNSKRDGINHIQQFISDFDLSDLFELQNQAEILLLQSKNEKGMLEFEHGWLNQDVGTNFINKCNSLFNAAQKQNLDFDKTSYQDLMKFKKIVNLTKNKENQIAKLFPPKEIEIKRGKSTYKLFLVSLFSLFAIAIVAIAVIIVAWVLH